MTRRMIIARSGFKTPCNAIFCKLICIDQFDQLTKCFNIMLTFLDRDYQTVTFHDMIKIKISITILIEFSQIKYGNGRGLLHRKKRFLVVNMFEYELFHVLQQQILMNMFISCFYSFSNRVTKQEICRMVYLQRALFSLVFLITYSVTSATTGQLWDSVVSNSHF